MADRPPSRQRPAYVIATGLAFLAALVVGIIFINIANSPPQAATALNQRALSSPGVTPGGTPSATPSSTARPGSGQIPFANCGAVSFGAPLPPLNPPADVHAYHAPPPMTIDTAKLYEATIATAKGSIVLCLQPALAPLTVNNFVTLARNHFYDGLTFHRVVPDFVVQGGDPQGTGSGGPGYQFADEPVRQQYVAGALAMANSGPDTNGSQFFICSVDDTSKLRPLYNLFGKVTTGMDVVARIAKGDVMTTVTVREQR